MRAPHTYRMKAETGSTRATHSARTTLCASPRLAAQATHTARATPHVRTTRTRIAIGILLVAGMVLADAPLARAVDKGAPPHWGAGMGVGQYA
ncbi:MAG: hypothetical protein ABII12_06120, partial [Planctomycetota bacterium]